MSFHQFIKSANNEWPIHSSPKCYKIRTINCKINIDELMVNYINLLNLGFDYKFVKIDNQILIKYIIFTDNFTGKNTPCFVFYSNFYCLDNVFSYHFSAIKHQMPESAILHVLSAVLLQVGNLLDIGANIGYLAIPLLSGEVISNVISYITNETTEKLYKINLSENKLSHRSYIITNFSKIKNLTHNLINFFLQHEKMLNNVTIIRINSIESEILISLKKIIEYLVKVVKKQPTIYSNFKVIKESKINLLAYFNSLGYDKLILLPPLNESFIILPKKFPLTSLEKKSYSFKIIKEMVFPYNIPQSYIVYDLIKPSKSYWAKINNMNKLKYNVDVLLNK